MNCYLPATIVTANLSIHRLVVAALVSIALTLYVRAADFDLSNFPPAQKQIDFVRDIEPILAERCYSCHGPDKQENELRWDTKAIALKGGTSGPAIIPGKSAESRMIHLVAGLEKNLVMPKKGERLTPAQIGLLRAWIDQGANWPEEVAVAKPSDKSDWWSFKPAKKPLLPHVKNERWARNEIDFFILSKLEQENLSPSPEADRRTLIRRLSFDLTGLPPTPLEVEEFLNDRNPEAYGAVVDRLLASPRYGERWARHWLDTVHYADTHGYDKDKPRPNAWPYRDYVIHSLNGDKPYSRFVEEQLAGDVLFPDEPDGIAALGFIAAGPWDFVGHVELPIEKTDGLIARYNDRDDMLMTTISTFQSLTVHCARCHNHKFDAITQQDYYSLQAVFAGVDRAERDFDPDKEILIKRRPLKNEKRSLESRLAALNSETALLSSPELRAIDQRLDSAKKEAAALGTAPSTSNGYHSGIEKSEAVTKWVQVDLGRVQPIGEIKLVPARPVDFADTPGFGFPLRFKVEVSAEPEFKNATTLTNLTTEDFANPGDTSIAVRAAHSAARYVRVTATKLWKRTDDYVFALAEIQVFSGKTNVALRAEVSALDSIESGLWAKKNLVDGFGSRAQLPEGLPLTGQPDHLAQLKNEISALEKRRRESAETLIPSNVRTELSEITNRVAALEEELKALPPLEKVYAAASDFKPSGSFLPAKSPRPVYLLARGEVKRPGELMGPAGIAAVPGQEANFHLPSTHNEGAGRAALAKWITDPKNLLTRRSIVNRVWHYHFGRGIVETPNDFGHMGALPTHPELLDWLAFRFQENGESLKKLHRLMVMSATYRQSSGVAEIEKEKERNGVRKNGSPAHLAPVSFSTGPRRDAFEKDADNRFLWRMNRSRLDAESIRDSMLLISGKLDPTMGGPAVQQFAFKDDHSPDYDYTKFDVDTAAGMRRSIYRFIVRSVPDPLMDSLDCPDPSILTPKRSVTMTSLQALAILNDPFVLKQSQHLAARVKPLGDIKHQIDRAFELALNRAASDEELQKLVPFAEKNGMANLCRLIFNTSEFMFAD
ncbi:MAG: DUF1553 domain-containing protein [Verrucomicrobiota bacterium]